MVSSTEEKSTERKSTNQKSTDEKSRLTFKKIFFHPLTWIAVGVHIAMLAIPFDPTPPPSEEKQIADEEVEAIPVDILNLSEIATDTPPPPTQAPPPAPPPPVTAPPAPQAIPPEPIAEAPLEEEIVEEPLEPLPAEVPVEAEPTEAEPTELVPNAPIPQELAAQDPATPAYDPSSDQQIFISGLSNLGVTDHTANGLPLPSFFRNPGNAGFFVDGDNPAPGATNANWLEGTPAQIFAQMETNYAASNLTFQPLDPYGGEPLYALTTATGEIPMYVSLVELKGSTLLVTWPQDPNTI